MTKKKETAQIAPAYTKQQILSAQKYSNRRDLLEAILKDQKYTIEQVDAEIERFKKGMVR
ncbi:hypothetical protein NE619_10420 [Anaerovorax odorimutans]|uniref:Phage protein n=1 Tax=Anaerovorax odorimutans TaxID=109327 RepID=A0ABT1RPN7_9FIRM|nr:hypothetical protein [Anaerovorax odorimutans]MCQ4637140.1 hypothetical protein [Anaerovorax odorimutans]